MKKLILTITGILISFGIGFLLNTIIAKEPANNPYQMNSDTIKPNTMKLGAFSMSLNVKDLATSKQFYENLGFSVFGGSMEKKYLIMKNGNALIGIFQGMFQGNILTFNPGWDENAKNLETFDDVREIQKHLKSKNITLTSEADEKTTGPASLMLTDPDGNIILVDQHR